VTCLTRTEIRENEGSANLTRITSLNFVSRRFSGCGTAIFRDNGFTNHIFKKTNSFVSNLTKRVRAAAVFATLDAKARLKFVLIPALRNVG